MDPSQLIDAPLCPHLSRSNARLLHVLHLPLTLELCIIRCSTAQSELKWMILSMRTYALRLYTRSALTVTKLVRAYKGKNGHLSSGAGMCVQLDHPCVHIALRILLWGRAPCIQHLAPLSYSAETGGGGGILATLNPYSHSSDS